MLIVLDETPTILDLGERRAVLVRGYDIWKPDALEPRKDGACLLLPGRTVFRRRASPTSDTMVTACVFVLKTTFPASLGVTQYTRNRQATSSFTVILPELDIHFDPPLEGECQLENEPSMWTRLVEEDLDEPSHRGATLAQTLDRPRRRIESKARRLLRKLFSS